MQFWVYSVPIPPALRSRSGVPVGGVTVLPAWECRSEFLCSIPGGRHLPATTWVPLPPPPTGCSGLELPPPFDTVHWRTVWRYRPAIVRLPPAFLRCISTTTGWAGGITVSQMPPLPLMPTTVISGIPFPACHLLLSFLGEHWRATHFLCNRRSAVLPADF